MNEIIGKMIKFFPDLEEEFKDMSIETQKQRIISDFYFRYLVEFNVDINNIKRVQLSQQIFQEEDIIPMINFINSINIIIPHSPLGLFDVIIPSINSMTGRISNDLRFLEFSDVTMNTVYEMADPYLKAIEDIKNIECQANETKEAQTELLLKITNKVQLIEERRARCKQKELAINAMIEERRALELQLLEIESENTILTREKQQSEAALKKIKMKLECRKPKLDRTIDCEEELNKLEEKLKQIRNDIEKSREKIDAEVNSNSELTKLSDNLAEKHSSAKQIFEALTTIKLLEEAKKEKEIRLKEESQLTSLDEVTQSIKKQNEEMVKTRKAYSMKRQQIQNTIDRKRQYEINRDKLLRLKKIFKDIAGSKRMLQELKERENLLEQEYKENVDNLDKLEMSIAKKHTITLNSMKDEATAILEKIRKLNNKKKS